MRKGVSLLWAVILLLTDATPASAQLRGGPLAPQPRPQPAFRAEDFVEFIGLNASPFDRYLESGRFKGAGTKYPPETFFDLGVRYYRTGLKHDLTPADMPQRVADTFAKYGARPMLLIDPRKSGRVAWLRVPWVAQRSGATTVRLWGGILGAPPTKRRLGWHEIRDSLGIATVRSLVNIPR